MSDGFEGAWRVREYVFDARGNALGTVAQRRRLEAAGDRVRVIQDCEPDPSLIDHPMHRFGGHHEFELARDGALRAYLGPAVVGAGVGYGDSALLGAGVWPGFGHDFTSWSILVAPDRQLTGGRFGRAGMPVAEIVGVAAPEGQGASWPQLIGPTDPRAIARRWRGQLASFDGDGGGGDRRVAFRDLGGDGYDDQDGRFRVDRDGAVRGDTKHGAVFGFARRYGWATRYQLAAAGGPVFDGVDVFDPICRRLVGFRCYRRGQRLTRVDVVHLSPHEDSHDPE